ncbi:MAG: hypothetical protein RJA70_469 [Pseudomonadota bacterium]|jgi:hypothetical protein
MRRPRRSAEPLRFPERLGGNLTPFAIAVEMLVFLERSGVAGRAIRRAFGNKG